MLKMKKKKITALCCALALVGTCSFPAFASRHEYNFKFFGKYESSDCDRTYWQKDDMEQASYVTVDRSSNWSRGIDRVYLWIHTMDGKDRTSTNTYVTSYVDSEELPYTIYTKADTNCRLDGWHNNNGHEKTFSVGGRYTP